MNRQPRKIYDGEGLGEDTAEANYVLEKMEKLEPSLQVQTHKISEEGRPQ